MARNSSTCLCRVPVQETAIPTFVRDEDLQSWAKANDVEILPNHRGEPSIDLPTAYRLYDEQRATDAAHLRSEAEKLATERATLQKAQDKRQKTYERAYTKAVRSGESSSAASQAGWEAVHEAEADLPAGFRERLAGVSVPHVSPPLVSRITPGSGW